MRLEKIRAKGASRPTAYKAVAIINGQRITAFSKRPFEAGRLLLEEINKLNPPKEKDID